MVILRRDIGYRLLNPLVLIATAIAIVFLAVAVQSYAPNSRPQDLMIFAAVFFLFGLSHRIKQWRELNRDARQHSYYIGTSLFDFRALPKFARRNRRIARFLEPVFCAGIGLALFPYSRALSMWLVFSAFCLRGFEFQVFERERNQTLDLTDSLIVSEAKGRAVERYEQTSPQHQEENDAGVPTGMGEDIREKIKSVRKKPPPL